MSQRIYLVRRGYRRCEEWVKRRNNYTTIPLVQVWERATFICYCCFVTSYYSLIRRLLFDFHPSIRFINLHSRQLFHILYAHVPSPIDCTNHLGSFWYDRKDVSSSGRSKWKEEEEANLDGCMPINNGEFQSTFMFDISSSDDLNWSCFSLFSGESSSPFVLFFSFSGDEIRNKSNSTYTSSPIGLSYKNKLKWASWGGHFERGVANGSSIFHLCHVVSWTSASVIIIVAIIKRKASHTLCVYARHFVCPLFEINVPISLSL